MALFQYYFKLCLESLIKCYSQIFFSQKTWFGILILAVTFIDPLAGFSGIVSVLVVQVIAILFDFRHDLIRDGTYTCNVAMIGVGMGGIYSYSSSFFLLLVLVSILAFFCSVWFMGIFAQWNLPSLSFPFVIVFWILILSAGNFSALELIPKTFPGPITWVTPMLEMATGWVGSFPLSDFFYLYFRSLGAIVFQFNDLAGILLALGILFFSRIAFILSLIGFSLGYGFYAFMEGDFSHLIYSYIGFNFILTAIALGGFFFIPSARSFGLLFISIPLITLVISAAHTILFPIGLPLYSLPFNLVVLLVLYSLRFRVQNLKLHYVSYQHFSPEKNHYRFLADAARYKYADFFRLELPFLGTWNVSQGYHGSITHKGDYSQALDFDVRDEAGKTFAGLGKEVKDYYCFGLPVLAPYAGYVVEAVGELDDNLVGSVDLQYNWGNTVVIKHADFLYSKLSHLKKGSLQVKKGAWVNKGDIVGLAGSSGRSPEPHLHFQLQSTPYIGSKTIQYPIAYYLKKNNGNVSFHSFEIPQEGEVVSNLTPSKPLSDAFAMIPGKKFEWSVERDGKTTAYQWEVFANTLNQTYLFCHQTGAMAYFVNEGALFYFTEFYGQKNSFLHDFYLGAHKVLLGQAPEVEISDLIRIQEIFPFWLQFIHDFTAPFFHYCKGHFYARVLESGSGEDAKVEIQSKCEQFVAGNKLSSVPYVLQIKNGRFTGFEGGGKKGFKAVCFSGSNSFGG